MAALGKRLLKIEIDGVAYEGQVSSARITAGDADTDFLTFADAATGGAKEYTLTGTIVQDLAVGSLWREMWDNTGDTVPFTLMPYGNSTPTAGQPHVEGSAIISLPDGDVVGGDASTSASDLMSVEIAWVCTAKPTLVSA